MPEPELRPVMNWQVHPGYAQSWSSLGWAPAPDHLGPVVGIKQQGMA